jgi:hypothetical protein
MGIRKSEGMQKGKHKERKLETYKAKIFNKAWFFKYN